MWPAFCKHVGPSGPGGSAALSMIEGRLLSRPPRLSWVFLLPTTPKETSFNEIVPPFRRGKASEAAFAPLLVATGRAGWSNSTVGHESGCRVVPLTTAQLPLQLAENQKKTSPTDIRAERPACFRRSDSVWWWLAAALVVRILRPAPTLRPPPPASAFGCGSDEPAVWCNDVA
jgi:hypothetical protein